MSLLSITAKISCDDCGKTFSANIDPATPCTSGYDAACDAMRGGEGSYYEEAMRCDPCTSAYVTKWIADHPTFINGKSAVSGGWMITLYRDDDQRFYVPAGHPAGEPEMEMDGTPWVSTLQSEAQS